MDFEHLQSFHPETRMGRGGNRSVMANFDSSPRLLRRKSHEWRGVKLIYWGSILVRIVLENEDNKTETWRSEKSGIRARNLTLNLFTWGSRFLSVFLQSVAIKDIFIMRTRTLWAPRPTADTKARGEFQIMTNLYFSTLVSLCLLLKTSRGSFIEIAKQFHFIPLFSLWSPSLKSCCRSLRGCSRSVSISPGPAIIPCVVNGVIMINWRHGGQATAGRNAKCVSIICYNAGQTWLVLRYTCLGFFN